MGRQVLKLFMIPCRSFLVQVSRGFIEEYQVSLGKESKSKLQALFHSRRKICYRFVFGMPEFEPVKDLFFSHLVSARSKFEMKPKVF